MEENDSKKDEESTSSSIVSGTSFSGTIIVEAKQKALEEARKQCAGNVCTLGR